VPVPDGVEEVGGELVHAIQILLEDVVQPEIEKARTIIIVWVHIHNTSFSSQLTNWHNKLECYIKVGRNLCHRQTL
jgi:hypothetical protein